MKAVADTLGVARSNLVVRAARGRRSRLPYRKAGDPELLARIRALVDQRPTYGYRRITALLNRERALSGGPNVNHKRVFRLMQRHGLLLERHSGRRPGRIHDGRVIVMHSNLRWCSDVFEITCWNGESVRVALVIDAHDREVIGWHGVAGAGIDGEAVRDLMLAAVEPASAASWRRMPSSGCPTMAAPTRPRTPATSPVLWACSPASPPSPAPRAMASPRPWSGRSNATTFASTRCRTPSRFSGSSTGGSPTTTTTTPIAGSACALPGSSFELISPTATCLV